MTREELVAVAMLKWEQSVIEAPLGKDAPSVLPEAIRLVELRARVPRYQRDVLRALARREGTSVDAVLTRAGAGRRRLGARRGASWGGAGAGHGVGVAGGGGCGRESTTGELIPQVPERTGDVCARSFLRRSEPWL